MVDSQRYWDGTRWTEHVAPLSRRPALVRVEQKSDTGLVVAGLLLALVMPFVGFILAIVLMAKGNVAAGLGVLVLSFVGATRGSR